MHAARCTQRLEADLADVHGALEQGIQHGGRNGLVDLAVLKQHVDGACPYCSGYLTCARNVSTTRHE